MHCWIKVKSSKHAGVAFEVDRKTTKTQLDPHGRGGAQTMLVQGSSSEDEPHAGIVMGGVGTTVQQRGEHALGQPKYMHTIATEQRCCGFVNGAAAPKFIIGAWAWCFHGAHFGMPHVCSGERR